MKTSNRKTDSILLNLDWGIDGVRFALRNREIVVVVDTLRFSTAVVTAIAHGFTIYPIGDQGEGKVLAASIGAEMTGRPGMAKYSLSPHSYLRAVPGDNQNVVIYSPNGAACAALAREDDIVLIGCLLNARAVGEFLSKIATEKGRSVTVVAAGEQRAIETGERIVYDKEAAYPVFAIEDYLASGAIIGYADLKTSAEADLCRLTFRAARRRLKRLLLNSFSGRYLVQNGLEDDITHSAKLNHYNVVPVMHSGKITKL